MDFLRIAANLAEKFPQRLQTVDSHTAGEPTRLILGGTGTVPGATMAEKRRFFMENLDHVRRQLTCEPRGHRGMFTALVTEPVTDQARFGLIYMDPRRYPFLCGHATMGAVTTLLEAGVLPMREPETSIVVDTPSGPLATRAFVRDGQVDSVAIRTVPSFVYGTDETLTVPGLAPLQVDTVCVGGFFVMVAAHQIGLELISANSRRLVELGMTIIDAANQQLTVRHPTRPEVTTVDVVEFYDASEEALGRGKNFVVYGESHMDRSPCGTGTAAKLTLLHHRGRLALHQPFHNSSCLGSTFEGSVAAETTVGDRPAIVAEIRGSAHITGIHEFIVDPRDPFPQGFLP